MITYVSQRWNIVCVKFKIRAFFTTKLINQLYVVVVLWKTFTDCIIWRRGELWAKKDWFNSSCFIEVSITTQESNCHVYYVLGGIEFALVSTIFRLDFLTVLR